jgi:hypothetical protein
MSGGKRYREIEESSMADGGNHHGIRAESKMFYAITKQGPAIAEPC